MSCPNRLAWQPPGALRARTCPRDHCAPPTSPAGEYHVTYQCHAMLYLALGELLLMALTVYIIYVQARVNTHNMHHAWATVVCYLYPGTRYSTPLSRLVARVVELETLAQLKKSCVMCTCFSFMRRWTCVQTQSMGVVLRSTEVLQVKKRGATVGYRDGWI